MRRLCRGEPKVADAQLGSAPIMLDVDTGIDDALAIALAVESGVRLIGVSTVAGNAPVDPATENTLRVLAQVGAESVPVHRGASRPLAAQYRNAAYLHGEDGLAGVSLDASGATESSVNAVSAILDNADRCDGELVLVALGPLTNVAIALSLRPKLARQIRRLVVMGSAIFTAGNVTPHAEFNAFADPHALDQVMATEWNELIAVGLDVSHGTVFTRDQWERLEESAAGPSELVRQIAASMFMDQERDGFYLHDPLAVAVALDDSLVTCDSLSVNVAVDDEYRGKTTAGGSGNVRVATTVDAERFEREFAERLGVPKRSRGIVLERVE